MRKQGTGFLSIAQNTNDVNYLELAYLQGLNIKLMHHNYDNSYSVLVDAETMEQVTDRHREVIDNFILLPNVSHHQDPNWKLAGEQYVFDLTPYKITYKCDVDVLFSPSAIRQPTAAPMCFANFVTRFDGTSVSTLSLPSRAVFKQNNLPNIYTAYYNFRYCREVAEFFDIVKNIYADWAFYRDNLLVNCRYEYPRQDEVFALALMIHPEHIASTVSTKIIHMKPDIQNMCETIPWYKQNSYEIDEVGNLMVGFKKIYDLFHYVDKGFAAEVTSIYEQRYRTRFPETNI